MIEELQDSTLALQHFYALDGVHTRNALGTVFDATAMPFENGVSVWVFDRLVRMGADSALVETLETRAQQASRLDGPGVVRVVDSGRVESSTPFVVCDRVEGRSLRQHIALHGPLDLACTARALEQLGEVIQQAHRQGFSRLGLDAGRVVVDDPSRMAVRFWGPGIALQRAEMLALDDAVIDLDLVRPLPPSAFRDDDPTHRANTSPGSPRTDATQTDAKTIPDVDDCDDAETDAADSDATNPAEPADGEAADSDATATDAACEADGSTDEVDSDSVGRNDSNGVDSIAADVYSLAALAYECLSGHHPWFRDGREVGDGILAMLREKPASLAAHHGVAPAVSHVIHAALDPASSPYGSVADLLSALRAALPDEDREAADALARPLWLDGNATLPAPGPSAGTSAQRARPKLVRALIGLAALLLVGNAVFGIMALQEDVRSYAHVPEFVQPAGEDGVDVIIDAVTPVDANDPSAGLKPRTADLYVVSTRGETRYVAQTPFVLRDQPVDARLQLVLSGDEVEPHPFEVRVEPSDHGLQVVRELVAPQQRATALIQPDPTSLEDGPISADAEH